MPGSGTRSPTLTAAKRAKQAAREQRLGEALRVNLRRRKEQARARQGAAGNQATGNQSAKNDAKDDRGGD